MNERIKELYEQCFVVLENNTPNTGFDVNKFAELIVRECATVSRQHLLDHAERSYLVHRRVLEHFGVEE